MFHPPFPHNFILPLKKFKSVLNVPFGVVSLNMDSLFIFPLNDVLIAGATTRSLESSRHQGTPVKVLVLKEISVHLSSFLEAISHTKSSCHGGI